MAGESCSNGSTADVNAAAIGSSTTQRPKKRKWDQPAEILVSAGIAVPGVYPMTNMGPVVGGLVPGAYLPNSLTPGGVLMPHGFQISSIHQHASAAIQKLIQPKIQDELIAREIVINEAEASIRYKLTKRQTQEEIQKCTGAVVITRGKYRPPGALPDGEKPLYLHISSGAHLKEMAQRIIAVDRAAAMVEEILKPGHNSQSVSSSFQAIPNNALSTCVYLGFDTDTSANIAARIRGPNDQYINHIMNETGAAVILRGRGAGLVEESQQPLHLYLSSNSPKSLEDAKRLAENLLDTISVEFGATRACTLKLYNAVPPPQHLLAGIQSSGHAIEAIPSPNACLTSVPVVASSPVSSLPSIPRVAPVGVFIPGQSLPHSLPPLSSGTSYNGYGGIYPQATALQQVALALRQSSSPTTPNFSSGPSVVSTIPRSSDNSASEKLKGRPSRRKFQELPAAAKIPTKQHQDSFEGVPFESPNKEWEPQTRPSRYLMSYKPGLKSGSITTPVYIHESYPLDHKEIEFRKPSEPFVDRAGNFGSTVLTPSKLVHSSSSVMPPPPPRTMPPPPPPPKFTSSVVSSKSPEEKNFNTSSKSDIVSDTLIKLTEYGDDDDDLEEFTEETPRSNSAAATIPKPFWAL